MLLTDVSYDILFNILTMLRLDLPKEIFKLEMTCSAMLNMIPTMYGRFLDHFEIDINNDVSRIKQRMRDSKGRLRLKRNWIRFDASYDFNKLIERYRLHGKKIRLIISDKKFIAQYCRKIEALVSNCEIQELILQKCDMPLTEPTFDKVLATFGAKSILIDRCSSSSDRFLSEIISSCSKKTEKIVYRFSHSPDYLYLSARQNWGCKWKMDYRPRIRNQLTWNNPELAEDPKYSYDSPQYADYTRKWNDKYSSRWLLDDPTAIYRLLYKDYYSFYNTCNSLADLQSAFVDVSLHRSRRNSLRRDSELARKSASRGLKNTSKRRSVLTSCLSE